MEPGYIKCKHCNDGKLILDNNHVKITYCKTCGGSGKIDWIKNIVGCDTILDNKKWYNISVIFNGQGLEYYHSDIRVNENEFFANVILKKTNKKFDVSFWINLTGQVDNLYGRIGGSV